MKALAISTQAEFLADKEIQAIKKEFDINSNEAALIRKERNHNSKCDSPCQVIPMMINTKVGLRTDISSYATNNMQITHFKSIMH